jgi:hypothetical protein
MLQVDPSRTAVALQVSEALLIKRKKLLLHRTTQYFLKIKSIWWEVGLTTDLYSHSSKDILFIFMSPYAEMRFCDPKSEKVI